MLTPVDVLQLYIANPLPDHRFEYQLVADDQVYEFYSGATFADIQVISERAVEAINSKMLEWSSDASNRDIHQLEEILLTHGAELAEALFDRTGIELFVSFRGSSKVLSVVCRSTAVRDLPWSLVHIEGQADRESGTCGKFIGQSMLVARPSTLETRSVAPPRQLRASHIEHIVHPNVYEKAKSLGFDRERTAKSYVHHSDLTAGAGLHDIIIVVCESSSDTDTGLRIVTSGGVYTKSTAKRFRFPDGSLVVVVSCESGCDNIAGAIAKESNCTVVASSIVVPADFGLRWATQWDSVLAESESSDDLGSVWRRWVAFAREQSVFFRLHGRWRTTLVGAKRGE